MGDLACRSCGKHQRQMVKVPNTVAVAKVLEVILNQSKGRPMVILGLSSARDGEAIVTCSHGGDDEVTRNGVRVDGAKEAARILAEARRIATRASLSQT